MTKGPSKRLTMPVNERIILPVSHWPTADQELWGRCCDGTGPDGPDNRACFWGARRRKIIEDNYGRFLSWQARAQLLEVDVSSDRRLTFDTVTAFTADMAARGLAPVSIGMVVGALSSFAQAVAPLADWSWLKKRYFRLKARATPRRDKRRLVVHSLALFDLGISLMDTASDGPRQKQPFFTASRYRDGLIIALMAARPLRIRNFQDIDLGRTLMNRSGTYWLEFDEDETKTGRPIGVPVPQHLTPYLETYLQVHRKVLLAFRPKGTLPTRCLWVSKSGEKMNEPAMRTNIMGRTRAKFGPGHAINPHLFRDCLATSIATDDPEFVRCIAPILGHTTIAMSEAYYNQATMVTAARRFTAEVMELRTEMLDLFDDDAVRAYLVEAQTRDRSPDVEVDDAI